MKFDTELAFFIDHQEELVAKYRGKTLVLRGPEVIGAYATSVDAYREALSRFPPGSFMLQPCEPGPSAYTVTVNSSLAR